MAGPTDGINGSFPDGASRAAPCSSLLVNVKQLYSTGLYSDLTITCNGREYKVHKLMLHTQSSYFRKLLSGQCKESAQNENVSSLVLDDDEPEVLEVLLRHLYHFTESDDEDDDVQSRLERLSARDDHNRDAHAPRRGGGTWSLGPGRRPRLRPVTKER